MDRDAESGMPEPVPGLSDDGCEDDPSVRDHPRRAELFPVLTADEIGRLRRFGVPCHYAKGDCLYCFGDVSPGVFVILSGAVRIVAPQGLTARRVIHTYRQRGEFTSDIAQLSSKPAVVDAHVIEDVDALLLRPDALSAVVVTEADLGEKIMRALILRRALAMEHGRGVVIVAGSGDAKAIELQNFLRRNGFPSMAIDAEHDADALALLQQLSPLPDDFPLVACPNGNILRNPDVAQLASCLGLVPEFDPAHVYDVAIIGAGPAGLAAAVYAASDGLSVAVFDCRAPGGQAGTSARIENYLGFPTGISGQELASRAFIQAQKFGAHIGIPCEVAAVHCDGSPRILELADKHRIAARTVVIASGAEYRRPTVENLTRFEHSGVYFWATPVEARLCRKQPVVLVGGGNSAGQAAVFLASHAEHVHMLVRGASLGDSMSHYLVDRIRALPNVTLHTRAELLALEGGARLERVRYRGAGGMEATMTTHHLFVFIGAQPNTAWLQQCCVARDPKGFVLTGVDLGDAFVPSLPSQTSVEGIFAIGDVRSGSTKRVASAVGEGAGVVAQIHQFLGMLAARL